jgi:hypothetical protein
MPMARTTHGPVEPPAPASRPTGGDVEEAGMRWVMAVCVAVLLAACGSGPQGDRSRHAVGDAPVGGPHATQVVGAVPSCFHPRTTAVLGRRHLPVTSAVRRPLRVSMMVGNRLRVRTFGGCAREVEASPQNARLRVFTRRHAWNVRITAFTAVRQGVVRLVLSMPMCAQLAHSECIGGIHLLGTLLVTVKPRTRSG